MNRDDVERLCKERLAVSEDLYQRALISTHVPICAEAHRQAMMELIDTGPAHNAHPAIWAPFVIVGEGGVAR